MDYERKYIKYKYKYLMLAGDKKELPPIPKKYNGPIADLYKTIKLFFNEVKCCSQELNISTLASINNSQKKFLEILNTHFSILKDRLDPIELTPIKDSSITIKNLQSYISSDLFKTILMYIDDYHEFISTAFTEVSRHKIPFYKIHPLKRINDTRFKSLNVEYSCEIGLTQNVTDCYTLIITQNIIRIKMQVENLIDLLNKDPRKTSSMESYLKDFHSKLEQKIKSMNAVLGKIEDYNRDNFCGLLYGEEMMAKYGNITIYDKNICSECKKEQCCGKPCIFSKSITGKSKCVMKNK